MGQETATLKFIKACGGSGTDDKGNSWTITSDAAESTFDSSKGIHYGTGKKQVSFLKATTSNYSDKTITKIVVNASYGSSTAANLSCSVGGNIFGSKTPLTNTNKAYDFEGSASGAIEIAITKSSSTGALYLLSIEITYKDAASSEKTSTTLSFGPDFDNKTITKNVGDYFEQTATLTPTIENAEITYTSSDESVAEIAGGIVEAKKEGTTIITATYTGDTKYKESSVSYTLNVVDNRTETTLSFGEDFDGKTIEKNVNDEFTQKATLTPAVEGATINYTSSNTDVADIGKDGNVLVYQTGTTIITASYAGDTKHKESSVSYTLNVVDNSRAETTLTFPKSAYTYNQGDENGTAVIEDNKAVLFPTEATGDITYTATGTQGLAEVLEDGSAIINTDIVGTATITAIFAGNNTYKPSTASYTIEVKKVEQIEDGVFDFTDGILTYESGLTPKKDYGQNEYETSTAWKAGNITIETTGNTRWFKTTSSNELRFYKGSSLTINAPEGFTITNVVFTGAYSFKTDEGNYNTNNGKWTGNANKITFSYNAKSGNIGVKTITVKYAKITAVTPTDQGFMTYAADYDVNYSELGFTAYAIKLNAEETKVTYNKFDGIVPAGKAVLLQGEVGKEFTLTPATESADNTFDTDLITSDGTVTTKGDLYYAFSDKVGNKPGFKLVVNGITIPAKRGYLKLKDASAAKFFSFDGGDGTTGIGNIEQNLIHANATIHNLAGQRVSKDYKGVIIVNGKKMVNK